LHRGLTVGIDHTGMVAKSGQRRGGVGRMVSGFVDFGHGKADKVIAGALVHPIDRGFSQLHQLFIEPHGVAGRKGPHRKRRDRRCCVMIDHHVTLVETEQVFRRPAGNKRPKPIRISNALTRKGPDKRLIPVKRAQRVA
jgi:hypothetical protein